MITICEQQMEDEEDKEFYPQGLWTIFWVGGSSKTYFVRFSIGGNMEKNISVNFRYENNLWNFSFVGSMKNIWKFLMNGSMKSIS